jgi:hypothetical protein
MELRCRCGESIERCLLTLCVVRGRQDCDGVDLSAVVLAQQAGQGVYDPDRSQDVANIGIVFN